MRVVSQPTQVAVSARRRGRVQMIYVVTYDLRSRRDRTSLFKTLRTVGRSSHQFMASGWVISTHKSAAELAARLLLHLDPEDSICITPLKDANAAYLPHRAASWVAAQQQLAVARARRAYVRPAA